MKLSEQRNIIRNYCSSNNIELISGTIDFNSNPSKEELNTVMLRENDNTLFVFLDDNSSITAYSIIENEDDFCNESLAQNYN